jgi:hypothetical protein
MELVIVIVRPMFLASSYMDSGGLSNTTDLLDE